MFTPPSHQDRSTYKLKEDLKRDCGILFYSKLRGKKHRFHHLRWSVCTQIHIRSRRLQTKGQAYVAFSRVTKLEGIFLLNFKPDAIKTDSAVTEEMLRLQQQNPATLITDRVIPLPEATVRICFFNAQSLGPTHITDFIHDPYIQTSTILAVTETWQVNDNFTIPGYKHSISSPRTSHHGGGAVLCSNETCSLQKLPLQMHSQIDAVAANVIIHSQNNTSTAIHFLLMYCPPRTLSQISHLIESFINTHTGSQLIIGGDLNIDLKTSPNNTVVNLLKSFGMTQITSGPTHHSGSHLDHVWTNMPSLTSHGIWTYYSDHQQIYIDIKM